MEGYSSLAKEANHLWLVGAFARVGSNPSLSAILRLKRLSFQSFYDLKIVPTRCHIKTIPTKSLTIVSEQGYYLFKLLWKRYVFSLKVSSQYIFLPHFVNAFSFKMKGRSLWKLLKRSLANCLNSCHEQSLIYLSNMDS